MSELEINAIKIAYLEGFHDGSHNESDNAKPHHYCEKAWENSESKAAMLDKPHGGDAAQMRKEFEAWARDNCVQPLTPYGDTFKNVHIRCRWEGWQAALATQPQAPQGAVTDAEVESAKLLLGNFNPNGNGRTVRVMLESFLRVRGAAPETPEGKK